MKVVETDRLRLRELTPEDLEPLSQILSDPITMSFWPAPLDLEATRQWIDRNLRSYAECGLGRWAVILKETDELIGDCGILKAEVAGRREYDLGYIIHHPYWRRGYAVEAAKACQRYAVETLGLKRLVANMPTDHVASIRVAEKIGMRWEKTFDNPKNRGLATHLYALIVGR